MTNYMQSSKVTPRLRNGMTNYMQSSKAVSWT